MVLLQQISVNARLKIKALRIALRNHGDQVFVTHFVLAQQNQVIVSLILYPLPIVPGAWRHIHFAADNGAYPLPLARLIKLLVLVQCRSNIYNAPQPVIDPAARQSAHLCQFA